MVFVCFSSCYFSLQTSHLGLDTKVGNARLSLCYINSNVKEDMAEKCGDERETQRVTSFRFSSSVSPRDQQMVNSE